MTRRVAAVYHAVPPGHALTAEWDTYEAPINGALREIAEAKRSADVAWLGRALAKYERFALAAARCFVGALPAEDASSQ